MDGGATPLKTVGFYLDIIGTRFFLLGHVITGVPIIGEFLAIPFISISDFFYGAANSLYEADYWLSSISLDLVIESVTDWLLKLLGATFVERLVFYDHLIAWLAWKLGFDMLDAFLFEADPIFFMYWQITLWFPFLGPLIDDPFGWIIDTIVSYIPALGYLFDDPEGWVLYMLGVPWFERFIWKDHLLAWLLHKWGLDMAEAIMFETNPIFWVTYQVEKRWPFLDDLFYDPIGWLWEQFKEAVERYIDTELDWLVRIGERVLNNIWEMRL